MPNPCKQRRLLPATLCLGIAFCMLSTNGCGASKARSPRSSTGLPHTDVVIHPGKRPEPVLVDPVDHRVYVGTETGGSVTAINDRTYRVLKRVFVGREVEDLALDRGRGTILAVSSVVGHLTAVSTRSLRIVRVLRGLAHPSGVAVDPRHGLVLVAESGANRVAIVKLRQLKILGTIAVPGKPEGIAVDAKAGRVFVTVAKPGRLAVISERSRKVIRVLRVGSRPLHPIRLDARGHRLYVVNAGSSTISVVDIRSLRVERTIATAPHPEGLDVEPNMGRIFVSNEGDPGTDRNSGHSVSVISLTTGHIIDSLPTLRGPDGIAYDSTTRRLWVSTEDLGRELAIKLPRKDG